MHSVRLYFPFLFAVFLITPLHAGGHEDAPDDAESHNLELSLDTSIGVEGQVYQHDVKLHLNGTDDDWSVFTSLLYPDSTTSLEMDSLPAAKSSKTSCAKSASVDKSGAKTFFDFMAPNHASGCQTGFGNCEPNEGG